MADRKYHEINKAKLRLQYINKILTALKEAESLGLDSRTIIGDAYAICEVLTPEDMFHLT